MGKEDKTKCILSYHPNKSSGFGGIENLVSSLRKIALKEGFKFIELFNQEKDTNTIECTLNGSSYIKRPLTFKKIGFLERINKSWIAYSETVKIKPNIFITYHPLNLIFFRKTTQTPTKLVLVQSNSISVLFQGFLLKFFAQRILNTVHYIVVYTKKDKEALQKNFNVDNRKIIEIPRACRLPTSFEPKSISNKIVTICRIHEKQKNLSQMIEIMKDCPEFDLDIYGVGSKSELLNLKQTIRGQKNVSFKGAATDVAAILKEYALFVMTSHYEGYGQSLIEARSQGLPLILFNTFEAADTVVCNSKNGFLIRPYDLKDFIEKIRKILYDSNLYSTMSREAITLSHMTEESSVNEKWKKLLIQIC